MRKYRQCPVCHCRTPSCSPGLGGKQPRWAVSPFLYRQRLLGSSLLAARCLAWASLRIMAPSVRRVSHLQRVLGCSQGRWQERSSHGSWLSSSPGPGQGEGEESLCGLLASLARGRPAGPSSPPSLPTGPKVQLHLAAADPARRALPRPGRRRRSAGAAPLPGTEPQPHLAAQVTGHHPAGFGK